MESMKRSKFYFVAFSSREPVSTSLENALVTPRCHRGQVTVAQPPARDDSKLFGNSTEWIGA
jgi:hypothetical protein